MASEPDRFASINDTCTRFGFSRSTLYRMLADPDSGLVDVVVRVPPVTGRIKVPQRAFESWLKKRGKIR